MRWMRNQLNELKPCEIHPGHFVDYCVAGFMKQMQCNVTPSLNIIKTTGKQVWLSVLNIRRTTLKSGFMLFVVLSVCSCVRRACSRCMKAIKLKYFSV